MLGAAETFVDRLRREATTKSCLPISPTQLATDPTVFMWGLAAANLDLAECYIGPPVRYLGVEIKRELPDGVDGEATREVIRR